LRARLVLGSTRRARDDAGHLFALFGVRGGSTQCGYAPPVASHTVGASPDLTPSRAWWLRLPAVLLSPRSVFFALREDDDDDVAARAAPLLLVIWLAGMAGVARTRAARRHMHA